MNDENSRFDALAAFLGFLDLRRQSRIEKRFEKEKTRESNRLRKLREQNDEKIASKAQALPEQAVKAEGEKSTDFRAAMARVCSKLPKCVLPGPSLAGNILRAIFAEAPMAGLRCLAQIVTNAWGGTREHVRFVAATGLIGLFAAWFVLGAWMSSPEVIVWIHANNRGAAFLAQESAYPESSLSQAQASLGANSLETIAANGVKLPVLDNQLGFDTRRVARSDWVFADRSEAADIAGVAALSRCIRADACRVAKIPSIWSGMAWGVGFSNAAVDALPPVDQKAWLRTPDIWSARWGVAAVMCLSAGLVLSLLCTSVWWIVAGNSKPGGRERMAALLAHSQSTLVAVFALAALLFFFMGLPWLTSLGGQTLAPAGAMAAQALVAQGPSTKARGSELRGQYLGAAGVGPQIDPRAVNWSWGSLPEWTKKDEYKKLYRDCEAAGFCGDRDAVENRAKASGLDLDKTLSFTSSDTETIGWLSLILSAVALSLAPALGGVLDIGRASRWQGRLEQWSTHGAQRAERQRILRAMRGVKKAPISTRDPESRLSPNSAQAPNASKSKTRPRRL